MTRTQPSNKPKECSYDEFLKEKTPKELSYKRKKKEGRTLVRTTVKGF